jgi:hypothetical protein
MSSEIQTLIFPKRFGWTVAKALRWADAHGLATRKVDLTSSSIRVRQHPPGRFKRLRTIWLGPKVQAVVGFY